MNNYKTVLITLGIVLSGLVTDVLPMLTSAPEASSQQTLIPRDITEKLLLSYSNDEQEKIQDDLAAIKKIYFKNTTPTPKAERTYIATAGGPGACKSTILETYLKNKENFVYADPDPRALRLMINTYYQSLTYHAISTTSSYKTLLESAYTKWRDASNFIANTLINTAYADGYNIAHGTTLTSPAITNLFNGLKAKQYKIILLLCYSSDNARVEAVQHRAQEQAFVQASPEDIINKGKVFHERFPLYFANADEIKLFWTEHFTKGSVCATTYHKGQGLTVHNQEALTAFIAQYDIDRNGKGQSIKQLTSDSSPSL